MSAHLQRDVDDVKARLLNLSAFVEDVLRKAILAFVYRRSDFGQAIIAEDAEIDRLEVELEEQCLKVMALHRPAGFQLRFLVAALKVNNDLERVGDLAKNIARAACALERVAKLDPPMGLRRMSEKVGAMVRRVIAALVHCDADEARQVCADDDAVDTLNHKLFVALQVLMERDSSTIEWAMHTLSVARCLERVADLATNIAEDVVFMSEGEIIRHQRPATKVGTSSHPACKTAVSGKKRTELNPRAQRPNCWSMVASRM